MIDGVKNLGKSCWFEPCKSNATCNFCGTGKCCRKGKTYPPGCDGTFGGNGHVCSIPGKVIVL